MKFEERAAYILPILTACGDALQHKGAEYARSDDSNANFKRVGNWLGLAPETVCLVYLFKHLDALKYYADRLLSGEVPILTEPIKGRVMDAVNYVLILGSLIQEREKQLGVLQ